MTKVTKSPAITARFSERGADYIGLTEYGAQVFTMAEKFRAIDEAAGVKPVPFARHMLRAIARIDSATR